MVISSNGHWRVTVEKIINEMHVVPSYPRTSLAGVATFIRLNSPLISREDDRVIVQRSMRKFMSGVSMQSLVGWRSLHHAHMLTLCRYNILYHAKIRVYKQLSYAYSRLVMNASETKRTNKHGICSGPARVSRIANMRIPMSLSDAEHMTTLRLNISMI